ncbi:hypothetical protein KC332_g11746 [Hortaea werneckii]|nr:hypothetical protein KC350_g11242 [Hortaea werneckii]KAI7000985.1 hypothetical protein KC329_g179 [Hortaea werneckii]KAI7024479.1 hypothetical protein KC366_g12335 [Hortaea werneckii]KAI7065178.1 hypothetical protein KC327_g11723 [Hortaea werneckii]KAI7123060.1 hypothetical protein KC337_g12172 [Hortaea werneckii]
MTSPALDQQPYTLANLPYGVVSTPSNPKPRCAVAIGSHAIDLAAYAKPGRFFDLESGHNFMLAQIFSEPALNSFAALPWPTRRAVRQQLQEELKAGKVPAECLVNLSEVKNHVPMKMGGFSDFYTSLEHCQNCSGEMTSAAIAKNWWYAPSVYNSRVSSVLPSPHDIPRPKNVYFSNGVDSEPTYGPTQKMDFELEMGYFVSKPVPYGEAMPIADAKEHVFGFVMLNDWSARDHQLFEMRPLGPFHSKGFGTSISNWVVPMEALEEFSCPPNTKQDPAPFPHLTWPGQGDAALDIKLRIRLNRNGQEKELGTSNLKYLYWTPYQQLTHHAASGCGMETGDLIGTGTISGSGRNDKGEKCELGCLYEGERTKTQVMPQSTGSKYQEGYIEDGDEIILEGWCENKQGEVVLGPSIQRDAELAVMNLARAQDAMNEFGAFFRAAHAYPLPSYPGHEKEMMLGMLMRKKLDPKTDDWVTQYSKSPETIQENGDVSKLNMDDLRDLWDYAGPAENGIVREMLENDAFGSLFTMAEQEDGIENVKTGLRRKLFEDDSDEEEEDAEEKGNEKMDEDRLPEKLAPPPEPGVDPSLPPMRLETVLRFITTGAMPPQR